MKLIFNPDTDVCSGIYIIEVSDRFYIGQTVDIERRHYEHLCFLRINRHANRYMQRLFNKHGESAFTMRMLEPIEDFSELDKRETVLVEKFWDRCRKCINIKRDATKPPCRKGSKLTLEQLLKWSQVKIGIKHSEEHKRRIGESKLGKKREKFSEEWIRNLSNAIAKTYNVRLLSPSGEIYGPITNLKSFSKDHGLYAVGLSMLIRGQLKTTRGWTLIKA